MFKKMSHIITCLTILSAIPIQSCSLPTATYIAKRIANSQALPGLLHGAAAIAASSLVGYAGGSLAPKKIVEVSPRLAGAFGATYAGAISACTIAPYMAYRKGKLSGLLAYGASLAFIVYGDYYLANKKRREFDLAQITYHSAYLAELAALDSPVIEPAAPCETCPHELCYPLAKILLAENLVQ